MEGVIVEIIGLQRGLSVRVLIVVEGYYIRVDIALFGEIYMVIV